MTIYNVEINKIFKILNDLSIDCKYVDVKIDDKTNTLLFFPVPPATTKPKELNKGSISNINEIKDLNDLI